MPENNPKPQGDESDVFIVIMGDPAAGFAFFGPFTDYEAAERFADGRTDTWTTHLRPPEQT
jgi:hypothetical protein